LETPKSASCMFQIMLSQWVGRGQEGQQHLTNMVVAIFSIHKMLQHKITKFNLL